MSVCRLPPGPVMFDLRGLEIEADERDILCHPHIGGVILFSRNFASVAQISALIKSIQELRQPRLLIAVDHEGGRVQRFQAGFSRLPACALFNECAATEQAETVARHAGWLMASELLAVGVDFSFAPVLDLGGTLSQVIGDRAFAEEPKDVARLAGAYIEGMKEAGMAAVGKHFPGHGSVVADSHVAVPYDNRPFAEIKRRDLIPFVDQISAGLPALMPAHVIYSQLDQYPAGFSAFWLKHVLRGDLGFQGTIFSEDLSMAGAEIIGTYSQRAELALNAGCDMVLVCNNQQGAIQILEQARIPDNPKLSSRLLRMRGHFSVSLNELRNTDTWKKRAAVITDFEKNK